MHYLPLAHLILKNVGVKLKLDAAKRDCQVFVIIIVVFLGLISLGSLGKKSDQSQNSPNASASNAASNKPAGSNNVNNPKSTAAPGSASNPIKVVSADACNVVKIAREKDKDPRIWSPNGELFLTHKKDASGVYQIYTGKKGSDTRTCLTCSDHPSSPKTNLNKLQAHWHPSNKWIIFGG